MEPISCWPPEDSDTELNKSPEQIVTSSNGQETCTNLQKLTKRRTDAQGSIDETEHFEKRVKLADREESFASVALARWWRKTGRHLLDGEHIHVSSSGNPDTFLRNLARHSDAQSFLHSEISRLKSCLLDTDEPSAHTHLALATFLEKVGQVENAQGHIDRALKLIPTDKEARWLHHKLKTQLEMKDNQNRLSKIENKRILEMPTSQQVERRSANELSVENFQRHYAMTSTPVIITELVQNMTTVPWTLEHIREVAGSTQVEVRKLVPGSVNWAQLETAETTSIGAFIDSLSEQSSRRTEEKRYLFDFSLPDHCPELAKEVTLPTYFKDNLLQKTTPGTLYHNSWPSLFVAPKGIRSELHVDAFGSNFWMALFQGQKRWIFFDRDDLPKLYPSYESDQSTDPVFNVNLGDPDFEKHPLLSLTSPRECILQPGELLFVPAGCPHYVENLTQSLAISSNIVDASNIDLVKAELEINSLLDECAADLLRQLNALTTENIK